MLKKCAIILMAIVVAIMVQPAMAINPSQVPMHPDGQPSQTIQAGHVNIFQRLGQSILTRPTNEAMLDKAKKSATSGIDSIIRNLNIAKVRVNSSKLSAAGKASLNAEIDANITWFESKKSQISSSNDVASVRGYSKEANDNWNVIKVDLKKRVGLLTCDDVDKTIVNARNASAIASQKIQADKARGKNTGNLEKKLASYNAHVNNAASEADSARSDFNQISTPLNADIRYSSGLRQLKMAGNELNGAYSDLKDIYRMLYGNATASA